MLDKLGPYELNTIMTGDARKLAKAIPDESIDLIFTDPPYSKEYLNLYKWLAAEANRILKTGGSILTLTATPYFDKIFKWFSSQLNYYWLNCYYQPTVTNTGRFWPKQIYIRWKPVTWFSKGERQVDGFIQDGVSGAINDKRFHLWGQDEQWAFYWIDQFSKNNNGIIVFDPFCGGGTIPAVCKTLKQDYLAFEIDPYTADVARQRVNQTQLPLPIKMPEQLTLIG